MKVKMLRTAMGSPNGWETFTYDEGEEYDLGVSLAKAFMETGAAKAVSAQESAERLAQSKRKNGESASVIADAEPVASAETENNGGGDSPAPRKRGGK